MVAFVYDMLENPEKGVYLMLENRYSVYFMLVKTIAVLRQKTTAINISIYFMLEN